MLFTHAINQIHFFAGGSPYPLLNNADFVALLRTGYRMEKPDLCSDDL